MNCRRKQHTLLLRKKKTRTKSQKKPKKTKPNKQTNKTKTLLIHSKNKNNVKNTGCFHKCKYLISISIFNNMAIYKTENTCLLFDQNVTILYSREEVIQYLFQSSHWQQGGFNIHNVCTLYTPTLLSQSSRCNILIYKIDIIIFYSLFIYHFSTNLVSTSFN